MGQRERPTGTLRTSRLQTTSSWDVFKQVEEASIPDIRKLKKDRRERSRHKKGGRPSKWSPALGAKIASLVSCGRTIAQAAEEVGVHPATIYRWQNEKPDFYAAMLEAERARFRLRSMLCGRYEPRPRVNWRKDCPNCGGEVVVRTTWGMLRFWTCSRRWCFFRSWRPPAPGYCPVCDQPLFFSHSRKSIGGDSCGYRTPNV
jgi:transposase